MKNLKALSIILGSIQVFIAIGAIPAGALFLADTSGAKMGVTPEILGVILCFWIIIQVKWITVDSFMQPMFFGIGAIETFLGWRIMKLTQNLADPV